MPAVDSTFVDKTLAVAGMFFKTRLRSGCTGLAVVLAIMYLKKKLQGTSQDLNALEREADLFVKDNKKRSKGTADKYFFKRLLRFIKIAIPSLKSRETGYIFALSVCLVIRTILSINLAEVNGGVVHGIIKRNKQQYVQGLFTILLYAVPSS